MDTIDTNVSNYTLSELMSIISVEDFDENEIIEKTNDLTNKFKHKKRMGEHPFKSFFDKNDR